MIKRCTDLLAEKCAKSSLSSSNVNLTFSTANFQIFLYMSQYISLCVRKESKLKRNALVIIELHLASNVNFYILDTCSKLILIFTWSGDWYLAGFSRHIKYWGLKPKIETCLIPHRRWWPSRPSQEKGWVRFPSGSGNLTRRRVTGPAIFLECRSSRPTWPSSRALARR